MNISSYNPSIFASLPYFQTVSHSLDSRRGCLQVLGEIICRFGFQEHIGISLLHKHFAILPHERLVKCFVGNNAYIRPYPQLIADNVVPYLWRFYYNQATGVQSIYPLEFVDTTLRAFRGRTDAQKLLSSEMFLAEFSATLHALNLENVFGLCTLHGKGEITLSDEETLLETTDHMRRILTLAPAAKTSTETVETSWQFTCDKNGKNITRCQAHCVAHCGIHEE
jgi:hypothetical protein